jgi:hypothetical protein
MKHDPQRVTTEVHDYGPGRMTSEPGFVRKPGSAAEDDGWMSYVYDPDASSATSSFSMPRTSRASRSRPFVCLFACRSAFTALAPDVNAASAVA